MTILSEVSSILGLISLDSNSTAGIPGSWYTTTFLFLQIYPACFFGIPLNLFVVYLTFMNKSIQNNYKYFLGNIAICDILVLGSLLNFNLVHVYVLDNNLMYTPFWCTLYRIWNETFSVCYLNSLPLVSINRYVVVVRQDEHIFTNRVVLYSCLLVYWPILYPILAFACPTHLVSDMHCGHKYWFPVIREFLLVPAAVLNIVSIFCVLKLFLFIREHIKTVAGHLDLFRLKDERSLLRAITIEGILPIVSCLPIVMMNIIGTLYSWDIVGRPWNIFGIIIPAPYLNISMGLFQLCPVIDPLLTLFCVRQYRRIIYDWFRRNFGGRIRTRVQSITNGSHQNKP